MTNLSQSNDSLPGKTPGDSAVIMTELVLPQHTNALGSIFGGVVMSWIDIAAAIASGKHSRSNTVTASIDALHFIAPIKMGDVVELKACVNATGRTSMEIGVRVDSSNSITGEKFHNVSAYLTFVAVDQSGKPQAVPAILPQTESERRRYSAALRRRASRVKLAQEIKDEAMSFAGEPHGDGKKK
jgi:acyl-CoA hydrolase